MTGMTASAEQRHVQRDAFSTIFGGEPPIAERLPMLPVAVERAANACSDDLRTVAALVPQIRLTGISRGVVGQLVDAEEGGSVVEMLHAPEWDSHLLVHLNRDLVFAYLEMVLGADGSQPAYRGDRRLTRIETQVARTLIARLGRALELGFASFAQTAFAATEDPARVDLDLMGGANAAVALLHLRIDFGDRGGDVQIAIPRSVLTALRPALAPLPAGEAGRADPGWSRQIQNEITRTQLILRAVLDERIRPMVDITNLQVGQILELEATPRSRIRVECNGQPLLWCEIGKSNGAYTLRVDGFIDHEEEFMHDLLFGR